MSFSTAVMVLLAIQPASAATPDDANPDSGGDTIVVRAQRLVDPAAVRVETIGARDIAALGDVQSVLETSPSVTIVSPGPAGATEILLRGGDANFTAVTIDGVRLNDVTDSRGGAVDVGAIAPFEIGSVTIYKGAVSVLEGSDALSGQIALETDDPRDGPRAEAMVRVADRGLGSVNGRWAPLRDEALALSVTGTWFDFGEGPADQTFSRASLGVKMSGAAGQGRWVASARVGETSRGAFADASGGNRFAATPDLQQSETRLSTVSLRYGAGETAGWSPSAAFTWLRRSEDRVTPAAPPQVPAGTSDSTFERLTLVGTASRSLSREWQALAGAEIVQEKGETTGSLDYGFPLPVDFELERTTPSIFAEMRRDAAAGGDKGALDLYAGIRADYVDTEEVVPTVRAGGVYHLPGDGSTSVYASIGTGFKAPSFYAVGDPLVGNPDLEDETSVTGEIGMRHAFAATTAVDLSVYHSSFKGLIDFDGETFSLVNRSEVEVSGIEASVSHDIGAHAFSAFGTQMNTDAPDGAVLLRPDWRAGFTWAWAQDRINAYASYRIRGEIEASSVPTGIVRLDPSQRLDLFAGYALADGLQVALTADNLLDSETEAQPGFTPMGRRLGIRLDIAY
ncbi:TonB-dependent receptor plug domain-containing protein [Aquisalinus flavus]|uniref:TonB-dependent receptor n=1 Tax=Aquisalinus flavus TaxID=1526572 RepID=A0A8J2V3C3_9PROT|nr:TonB-dependent receptor [Aquisalinus flavus]MBD0426051.1 TonB-dependent receptor [Aquisalinus flavus]UNE48360.1 TonB-dependent receptor [Aquisalinus flavus]GGD11120.1 TonB-dependent receptor [Aquisalinus flavus]